MTRRLNDIAEVTSANVDQDALLVRSESRGFVRQLLLKNLFGALPLLRGAGRALQKTGALVSRGDGNAELTARIQGNDNGSGRGARLAVGGNRNPATPAPGVWRLQDAAGFWCTLYVDDHGVLRITRAPEVTALNPRPGREVREEAGFDLHDSVTTEKTTIADSDRFFVSKEDEPGQPHRYIEADDMAALLGLSSSFPTTTMDVDTRAINRTTDRKVNRNVTIQHNLGVVPKIILVYIDATEFPSNTERLLGPPGYYDFIEATGSTFADFLLIQPTALDGSSATIWARMSAHTAIAYIRRSDGVRRVGHLDTLRFQFFG